MDKSNQILEQGITEKLRYAVKIKRVNEELAEQLRASLLWLIHFSEKHRMELPEKEKIITLINRSVEIEGQSLYQPMGNTKKTTEDETEPEIRHEN